MRLIILPCRENKTNHDYRHVPEKLHGFIKRQRNLLFCVFSTHTDQLQTINPVQPDPTVMQSYLSPPKCWQVGDRWECDYLIKLHMICLQPSHELRIVKVIHHLYMSSYPHTESYVGQPSSSNLNSSSETSASMWVTRNVQVVNYLLNSELNRFFYRRVLWACSMTSRGNIAGRVIKAGTPCYLHINIDIKPLLQPCQ